jgi:hypothetical protein
MPKRLRGRVGRIVVTVCARPGEGLYGGHVGCGMDNREL